MSFSAIFYITKLQIDLSQRRAKLNEVNKKITQKESENEDTQLILDSGNERDVIERIAREEFNYVLPEERVFYDISGN